MRTHRLRDYLAVAIGAVIVLAAGIALAASWDSPAHRGTPMPAWQPSPVPAISATHSPTTEGRQS